MSEQARYTDDLLNFDSDEEDEQAGFLQGKSAASKGNSNSYGQKSKHPSMKIGSTIDKNLQHVLSTGYDISSIAKGAASKLRG